MGIFIISFHFSKNFIDFPNYKLHTFYYPWYGNPQTDGEYRHWNHEIIDEIDSGRAYPGGNDIGANFYPLLGSYSSNDTEIIDTHLKQLKQSDIGVMTISWWGKDSFEDRTLPLLFNTAKRYGIKCNIHIEPFYKNISELLKSVQYLNDKYGNHPAYYKFQDKPMYYLYDSYILDDHDWQQLLVQRNYSVHPYLDANFISLIVDIQDTTKIISNGFDGAYSYFASDGFTQSSTSENWKLLQRWATNNGKIFIPSVGPGYIDTRIRPWNNANTKGRELGQYYNRQFANAILSQPEIITITSFNEWHEGTQIEPAKYVVNSNVYYENYHPLQPDYYLQKTQFWSHVFENQKIEIANQFIDKDSQKQSTLVGVNYFLESRPHEKYSSDMNTKLLDGELGNLQYKSGKWLGFENEDLHLNISLDSLQYVDNIELRFLVRQDAWIFGPNHVVVAISDNDEEFEIICQENFNGGDDAPNEIVKFSCPINKSLKYMCIEAESIGICPKGHAGQGEPAWLFIDEIIFN